MSQTDSIKTNIPEFSVGDLAQSLKKTLEETYGRVRVRGELSRVSIAASGHMYSSLKDANAVIDAVCWKGAMAKLSVKPEEGLEVICTGRITTYPARSNYQLIIEHMELAGQGALLKMLEDRRKKLAAEGLFDAARKRKIPFLPGRIGVVTSPTGAVIRDILHRLEDRFPRPVLVWPVLVQGQGAAQQIAAAIRGFNALPDSMRPDVLIVARGGGSLEDLMPFNEEIVVYAAAESQIPLISAVGHETDTTLIDYASDLRAPTPTGAAEMAVPVKAHLQAYLNEIHHRLFSGLSRILSEYFHRLQAGARGLTDPARLLEIKTQMLDHASERLKRGFTHFHAMQEKQFASLAGRMRGPRDVVARAEQALTRWDDQLARIPARLFEKPEQKLEALSGLLQAFSFEHVLARGFALVRDEQGHIVTVPEQISEGQSMTIVLKDKKTMRAKKIV